MAESFGQWLRGLRERAGLTQRELGDRISFSKSYICDVEHGNRESPSDKALLVLAEVLGVSADLMFYMAGRVPPDLRYFDGDMATLERALTALRVALEG